jgi:3-hydroxyisobutyrate dehydrogenase-like beta-hydroxyacid dehydrogenase
MTEPADRVAPHDREGTPTVSKEQSTDGAEAGPQPTVGVIGLGLIGDGIATSALAAGFPLVVADVRSEATDRYSGRADVAASATDLARVADIVVVAVVDDDQVHAVLSGPEGGLAAARPGTAFLIVSTISAACVQAIGAEATALGMAVVDCGVTGGPAAAASGDLVCMVGGDPADIERLTPLLDAIGSLTVAMGPFGTGLAAKLARNLVTYGSWLAAYEGQLLAEAAGIELAKLAEVIRKSDAQIGGVSRLMFRTTVAPFTEADDEGLVGAMRAAAGLAHKDLAAALELADTLDVALPLASLTDQQCDDIFGVRGTAGER